MWIWNIALEGEILICWINVLAKQLSKFLDIFNLNFYSVQFPIKLLEMINIWALLVMLERYDITYLRKSNIHSKSARNCYFR